MSDNAQIQLNAHLAEHARLVGESHATFQRQQQIINIMVLLASAITGLIVQNQDRVLHGDLFIVFVLIPVPFLILSALHLRDDLKIHAIDEYIWLVLREEIKTITGLGDEKVWNYLRVADRLKFGMGAWYGYYYMALSYIRYALPFLVVSVALSLYVYSGRLMGKFRWPMWSNWGWLFWADVIVSIIIFGGGGYLVNRSSKYIKGEEGALITKKPLKNRRRIWGHILNIK